MKIFSQQLDWDMKHFLIDPRAEFLSVSKSAHRVSDRPWAILNILEKYNLHREHFIYNSFKQRYHLTPHSRKDDQRVGYKCCHVLQSSSEHERSDCQQKLIRLMLEKRQIFTSCEKRGEGQQKWDSLEPVVTVCHLMNSVNKQRESWLMPVSNL